MSDINGADDTEDRLTDPDEEGVAPGLTPHQDEEGEIPVAGSEAQAERMRRRPQATATGTGTGQPAERALPRLAATRGTPGGSRRRVPGTPPARPGAGHPSFPRRSKAPSFPAS